MRAETKKAEEKIVGGIRKDYVAPQMEKHDPVKVVQGSGSGCTGLYYTTLYYYYYYY